MKKIITICLCLGMISLSGCTKGEEVTCNIAGKKAIFELKNGIISSYTFDGTEIEKSKIDEINGEYFTSSTNNEEGKETLKKYVESFNGSCEN